jgi:hypothetical protein
MAELRATYSFLLDRKRPQQRVCDLCEFGSLWAVVVLVVKPREPTGLPHRPHGFTRCPDFRTLRPPILTIDEGRTIRSHNSPPTTLAISLASPLVNLKEPNAQQREHNYLQI